PGKVSIRVSDALLAQILTPYKLHCRYLKQAVVETPTGDRLTTDDAPPALAILRGQLAIERSCHRDRPAELGAVELNLAYNQIIYVLIAQCIIDARPAAFQSWTLDEYRRRQLPDVLIHDFACQFHSPVRPQAFEGLVAMKKAVQRRNFLLMKTYCAFRDDSGGFADGEVVLAIVDGESSRKNPAS
ncbi:MAG: FcoT family thioesterase, partial [Planctomycetota bacterium]